jgi:hypothetical protein
VVGVNAKMWSVPDENSSVLRLKMSSSVKLNNWDGPLNAQICLFPDNRLAASLLSFRSSWVGSSCIFMACITSFHREQLDPPSNPKPPHSIHPILNGWSGPVHTHPLNAITARLPSPPLHQSPPLSNISIDPETVRSYSLTLCRRRAEVCDNPRRESSKHAQRMLVEHVKATQQFSWLRQ